MFKYKKLTNDERIKRMKIELQEDQPFWARLILNMSISADKDNVLPKYGGMGVNAQGDLIYKNDFVEKLSDSELKFCLAHEVAHVMFGHMMRRGKRNALGWNIVVDLAVNEILNVNNFTAPNFCLMPDHNHSFEMSGTIIENINKKTAEQIYDELPEEKKQNSQGQAGQGKKGDDDQEGEGEGYEG